MGTISKRGESTDDESAPSEISSTNSPEGFIHDNSRLNRAENWRPASLVREYKARNEGDRGKPPPLLCGLPSPVCWGSGRPGEPCGINCKATLEKLD